MDDEDAEIDARLEELEHEIRDFKAGRGVRWGRRRKATWVKEDDVKPRRGRKAKPISGRQPEGFYLLFARDSPALATMDPKTQREIADPQTCLP